MEQLCMHICVERKENESQTQKHASVLFKVGNGSYQVSEKYT